MKDAFRWKKTIPLCTAAVVLLCGAFAAAQSRSMDCTRDPSAHVKLAEGDQSSSTHLQLLRKIATGASVQENDEPK